MKTNSDGKLKITLIRSRFGRLKKHTAILECLKLRRINQSVIMPDEPSIRGMVKHVGYLIKIEEAESSKA
jgi:large subunit ribosomal protein L30